MGELYGTVPSLILEIATLLVDDPSSLSLYVHEGSETTELILVVAPEDETKVIGTKAATIRAIRTILKGSALRYPRYRFTLIALDARAIDVLDSQHRSDASMTF